jgi:hypothetical protein
VPVGYEKGRAGGGCAALPSGALSSETDALVYAYWLFSRILATACNHTDRRRPSVITVAALRSRL